MEFVFAVIAALSLSSIPLVIGWRRTTNEEATARVLGIASRGKKFDPDRFALQTGTGLTFNQIAIGFGAWAGGSFFAGLSLGLLASILFGIAGGLLYAFGKCWEVWRVRKAQVSPRHANQYTICCYLSQMLTQGSFWTTSPLFPCHQVPRPP